MAAKVIYFKVGDKEEQAEFAPDVPTEDIKGITISFNTIFLLFYHSEHCFRFVFVDISFLLLCHE